jgi:protein arginine N-methyltransferase 1
MIADRVRLDAYVHALERVITPQSVVLDIGAGTGIMSLLACKLGARRVYAIEPSSLAQLIPEAARDNGFEDRIVLLQQRSTEVTLPELADVIMSDLRGVLPPFKGHFADIADARARFLAADGHLIPCNDTLFAAVVTASRLFERTRSPWQGESYGLKLGSALRFLENIWRRHNAAPEDVLSEPTAWARLDYMTIGDLRVRGSGTSTITRDGTAHGLLAWFDTQLTEGVGFSTRPGTLETVYGQGFFPWPCAVTVQAGDIVTFELRADPVSSDYVWTWSAEICSNQAPDVVLHRFRQSTFLGNPIAPETLRKSATTFTPTLSEMGEITLRTLERMRGGATLHELGNVLHDAHPERFRSFDEALAFVTDLSKRYSV